MPSCKICAKNAVPAHATAKKATNFGMNLFNGTYLKFSNNFLKELFRTQVIQTLINITWQNNSTFSFKNFSLACKCFYTSARKKDGSFYKSTSIKSIRAAIDRYLRSAPHNKSFSIISDPAFTEANNLIDAFVKEHRKRKKLPVYSTNLKTTIEEAVRQRRARISGEQKPLTAIYRGQPGFTSAFFW